MLRTRVPLKKGGFGKADRAPAITVEDLGAVSDERERRALVLYQAAASMTGTADGLYVNDPMSGRRSRRKRRSPARWRTSSCRCVSALGRLMVRPAAGAPPTPIIHDGDPPWEFALRLGAAGRRAKAVTARSRGSSGAVTRSPS